MPNTKIPKVHLEDEEIDSDEHSEMFTDGGMSAVRSFAEACQTEAIVIAAIETEEKAIDIFNDERDAASTDEARSDHGSVLENLYKEAARLTITPDRRSVSRVTVDAKERLVRLTNWTCPITKESTQINLPRVIEAAHVVRRSLKGEQLVKLEFILGCKHKGLHIDTTKNLMHMRVDLHRAYDGCAFIFAPEQNILQQIKDHLEKIEANISKDPNYYGREGNLKSYKEITNETRYVYTIVPLLWHKRPKCPQIVVQGREPKQFELLFQEDITEQTFLYSKLPQIESHINPFFAVADSVVKISQFLSVWPTKFTKQDEMELLREVGQKWDNIKVPIPWLQKQTYTKRKPPRDRTHPDTPDDSDTFGDPNTPSRQGGSHNANKGPRRGADRSAKNNKSDYKGKGNSLTYQFVNSLRISVEDETLSDRDSAATSDSSITGPLTGEELRDSAPVDNSKMFAEWLKETRDVQHTITPPPLSFDGYFL